MFRAFLLWFHVACTWKKLICVKLGFDPVLCSDSDPYLVNPDLGSWCFRSGSKTLVFYTECVAEPNTYVVFALCTTEKNQFE
jgi:hypothetical protein